MKASRISALAALLLLASPAAATEYVLSATLTGATEVPGPGDPKAGGAADLTLDTEKLRLCYSVETNVEKPTMMHVHAGAAGVAGPPVLTLATPKKGSAKDCIDVAKDVADAIAANPGGYYVNVHNAAYPMGAVRGQLAAD